MFYVSTDTDTAERCASRKDAERAAKRLLTFPNVHKATIERERPNGSLVFCAAYQKALKDRAQS